MNADTMIWALEAVPSGVFVVERCSPENPIIYCNDAFTKITGFSREDVIGENWHILFGRDDDQLKFARLYDSILANESYSGIFKFYRQSGSAFNGKLTVSSVIGPNGESQNFVGILEDVAEQQDTEILKRERESLAQARKTFDQILGVVGHELRTPLCCLRLISELLKEDDGGEERKQLLTTLHGEVVRLTGIAVNLLEVSRLNSDVVKWNWGSYLVVEQIRLALASISVLIPEEVELLFDVEREDLAALGDGTAIGQMILNLVTNSLKNTEQGYIRIKVQSYVHDDGSWLMFEVADSGRGIEPSIVKQIGEPFALNSGVISDGYTKGSGLGLAICKGIVAAHGGNITIKSHPGGGTIVTVKLRSDLQEPLTKVVAVRTPNHISL